MKTIEEIEQSWEEDSNIDRTDISNEILEIPKLHCKYLKILNYHKSLSLVCKAKYDKFKNIKTEYYLGHLDEETLKEYGWDQFDLKLGSKGNIDRYLSSDDELIKILQKKAYHDQAITTCEQIMLQIKDRSWQLRSYIDYEKFLSGA